MSERTQVIRGRCRRVGWTRVTRGVHVPVAASSVEELRAWSAVLPAAAAFTHLTAAAHRGWWLPAEVPHPVFVAVPGSVTPPRRPGLLATRHPVPPTAELVRGIRVTVAAETLLACARDLSLLDLVQLGDAALHLRQCTLDQLDAAAGQRRRGAVQLRRVIPLLDGRSESAWESCLRVLHRVAEIDVQPQHQVFDASGRFVARGDLWLVGTRRLHEYDGGGHRDKQVHRRDLVREAALVEAGWQRKGFVAGQVLHEAGAIIASADRLLGRPWNRRRLQRWETLVAESLFGAPGRSRVADLWSRCI